MPKTIIFDLDGTICEQTEGGFEAYSKAAPRLSVISRLNELREQGNTIVIHTARGMKTYGNATYAEKMYRDLTEGWLTFHGVRYNQLVFGKPAGDLYVDDKASTPDEFLSRSF
ncbi:MAG: phosphatase domain-containing protein [Acidiferrobacterales bacterium]